MTTLLLVRHGESQGNKLERFMGQTDVSLTPFGKKQAVLAAEFLNRYKIDALYSSDLARAYETAEEIGKKQNLAIRKCVGLREIYAGDWEGMKYDEIFAKYPCSYKIWLEDFGKAQTDSGESAKDLYNRVSKTILEILAENENKTVCIVTHAAAIRTFQSFAMGKDVAYSAKIHWVPNASLTGYTFENQSFNLLFSGKDDYLGTLSTSFSANV